MKDKLLLLRNQLKMGHRISFAEAMLLQRAIDILVSKAGNLPVNDVTAGKLFTNGDVVTVESLTTINPAPTLDLLPKNAESLTGNSPANPDCWCRTCRPVVLNDMRFVVCPDCGNKRCPRANDHRNSCTGSNEPGQEGSAYPDNQQSPGSEPATVPGKWIPVSERMPEKGQAVLVYRPKAHEGGDSDVRVAVYGRHNFEHGFGCYWEPSHWMPLPAAPQEVGDA
jgi:hypothetical protein|nr:MAG TPA: Protein of unknown function (DUF551) [Caudoviricetes sp.]